MAQIIKKRILYGIQCTGNGHLSRSREVIKKLIEAGHEVDVCLSGKMSQLDLSGLTIKYAFEGLKLDLSGSGELSIWKTLKGLRLWSMLKSAWTIDLSKYDVIVSDFEPVLCWAGILRRKKVLGISNQFKFLSNKKFLKNLSPNFFSNKVVTKLVCPVSDYIAFDYLKEGERGFFPIIRNSLRKVSLAHDGFNLVYLGTTDLALQVQVLKQVPESNFYVFHKDVESAYDDENVKLRPIDKARFTEKLLRCSGVITNAGFQTTSECLYLGKKMLVIPIKNQIEQAYNANVLKKFGVMTAPALDDAHIRDFVETDYSVKLNYVDEMELIVEKIAHFQSK